ncbi:Cu/Ag efflux protein CusF OS=Castellaniella defragrans OX=75697 GN=HNR28_000165 PE=4 SV=1 [Castellaniella defragrans]
MHVSLIGGLGVALASVAAAPALVIAAQPVQARAQGTVVRIDAAHGRIAIRHGAISALELPAMTLFYHIDPALLKGVSVGDRVSFTAERANGQYRIVALEK